MLNAAAAVVLIAAQSAPASAGFTFSAEKLDRSVRERIVGVSWHPGCPRSLDQLRHVRVAYWGFGGNRRTGELVVSAGAVRPLRTVFKSLYRARFPIHRMRLVDDYRADDYASIEADDTSAFNCRRVAGSSRWSEHAYGRAIDINPIENPYVFADGTTSHPASRRYLRRRPCRRGMACPGGPLVRAFAAVGWGWGGEWKGPRDYQHFSATGR